MKEKQLYILAGVFVVLLLVYFVTKPHIETVNIDEIVQTVVFGVSKDAVADVEVYKETGGKEIRMEFTKQEDNQWRTPTTFNAKVREYNMNRLLDDVLEMTGKVATDDPKHQEMFEITDNMGIHLLLKDQAEKPLVNLIIGKRGEDFNSGFVRFGDKEKVYRVDKNILSALGVNGSLDTLSHFNTKSFIDLNAIKEDKAKLHLAGLVKNRKEMVIQKVEKEAAPVVENDTTQAAPKAKEYEWVLLKGEKQTPLDQKEVENFLRDVTSIYTQEVVDGVGASLNDMGKPAKYGVDRASNALVLEKSENNERVTVLFGKEFEKDKGYYMYVQNDGLIYKVAKSKYDTIFKWFDELPTKLPKPDEKKK
ncbi:DUF4340 domain-containing protein [candidate division KSB1 bacterium]|nr:DUF4340 domain-containing protein [candidate division KSB1 bacterium]